MQQAEADSVRSYLVRHRVSWTVEPSNPYAPSKLQLQLKGIFYNKIILEKLKDAANVYN